MLNQITYKIFYFFNTIILVRAGSCILEFGVHHLNTYNYMTQHNILLLPHNNNFFQNYNNFLRKQNTRGLKQEGQLIKLEGLLRLSCSWFTSFLRKLFLLPE